MCTLEVSYKFYSSINIYKTLYTCELYALPHLWEPALIHH